MRPERRHGVRLVGQQEGIPVSPRGQVVRAPRLREPSMSLVAAATANAAGLGAMLGELKSFSAMLRLKYMPNPTFWVKSAE